MTLRRYLLPILVALPLAAAPVLAQPVDAATAAEQPAAKRVSKGEQQALKWFAMLDANKDGRISRQEARVAFRLSPTLAEYFRDTDLDGDGYLTQQEIRTVAERRRAERQRRRQQEAAQAAATPGTAISRAAASTERTQAR
ncbi:EF-hand domain-containing protein [Ottowia sp.]|uniref:EF-hand domain-containing protein n=1 Tax=Ottowia sp. TaxID=1898956 RepID=UPI002B718FFD|nr:EF-hand domain-containing protein [Ottowia sp.]HRN75349.1 EF-hand domain-containing protein [Ottowia sp.]HRQ02807.1 EF-hand domain-containing protein [Ottowia sp.]